MSTPQPKVTTSRWTLLLRTALYLLGGTLQKAAYILLLPLLVASLSPAEYSRFGLMISAMVLLTPLLTLNVHIAPGRLYFDYLCPRRQASLLTTAIVTAGVFLLVGVLATLAIARVMGPGEPVSHGAWSIHLLLAVALFARVGMEFGLILLRVQGRAASFGLTTAVQGFGLLGLFVALGWAMEDGLSRVALAVAGSYAAGAVLVGLFSAKILRGGRVDRGMFRSLVAYSWPVAVHQTALFAVSYAGRWIGLRYMTLEQLAPYTLVTQIHVATIMVSRALFEARRPEIGSAFGAGDVGRAKRIIRHTLIAGAGLVLVAYAAMYAYLFVLRWPFPLSFRPTPLLLAAACVASLLDVAYLRGIQLLFGLKKTRSQAAATVTAASVTVAASFLLVGWYRDEGLIAAVILGLALQAVASNAMAWYKFRQHASPAAGGESPASSDRQSRS